MRAALAIAGLVLAGTTQVLAQPPAIVLPEPLAIGRVASHSDTNSFQDITSSEARAWVFRNQLAMPSQRAISFGPISMDVGNADFVGRDGKRARFAHIELNGVHILGGNVSGNFDGRAATLHLNWHFGE